MARPKRSRRQKSTRPGRRRRSLKRSAKRPTKRSAAVRHANTSKARTSKASTSTRARRTSRRAAPQRVPAAVKAMPRLAQGGRKKKSPRLDRVRRTLEDTVQTPPSSLNMDRHGSAARTGRAELAESRQNLAGMPQDITGGDVDVDVEDAYFTGDEAPGGDNPSPDLAVVDDIGKALGVQYDDNEELKAADKIVERDRHRWEMDPASSEDYKDRK